VKIILSVIRLELKFKPLKVGFRVCPAPFDPAFTPFKPAQDAIPFRLSNSPYAVEDLTKSK